MKANELRIKNITEYNGQLCEVTSVYTTHFKCRNIETHIDYGDSIRTNYIPVPITEEWLKKFGFDVVHQKNKHYQIQDPNGIRQCFKIHVFPTVNEQWHIAFSDKSTGKEVDYIPTTAIKHVHQLQNLYFALTREELTIKTN